MSNFEKDLQIEFTFNRVRDTLEHHSTQMFKAVTEVLNGQKDNLKLCLGVVEVGFRVSCYMMEFFSLQSQALGTPTETLGQVAEEMSQAALKRFEEVYKLTVNEEGKVVPLAPKLVEVPKLVT